mgnify:CR=1 FL=1
MKRDSNKEGESQRLSEENIPADCFCRRWQRAKRGERGDSLGEIPCSPPKKTKPPVGVVLFFYNEKGFEQGGRKAKPFGRKQSGGLFLPTVATSKARRERRQPRKNPLLSVKTTTPRRSVQSRKSYRFCDRTFWIIRYDYFTFIVSNTI